MVQTYGIARDDDTEPREDIRDGEATALLGGTATTKDRKDGHASLTSCVSNLSNTIIGSGMLTFPLSMASTGLLPGVLTCFFSGAVAAFGLYLLSLCAPRAPNRRSSFFAIAQLTFPKAALFFDAAIAIKCFGVSVSYLIIIKTLMPGVVESLYHDLASPTTNPPAWALSGRIWISLFLAILVPLCFLRRLDSLRHTSYVALFTVAYLVTIVITCYFHPLEGTIQRGEVKLVHFTSSFVSTFPVQVFAYTCAQNLFPVYNEIATNTQHRMNIVIGSSIGLANIAYEIIAVFGYLTFGSKVGDNIIAMYPSTTLFIAVGRLAIVILVLFSYPLQVLPCRNCLDKLFHTGEQSTKQSDEGEEEAEAEDTSEAVEDEHVDTHMSFSKHSVLTSAIIIAGFIIAYFVNDLKIVLSFVGSTGSTTISFILPGLFYWKLTRKDANVNKMLNRGALALALYGIFIFVFCLSYNIYQVMQPKSEGSRLM